MYYYMNEHRSFAVLQEIALSESIDFSAMEKALAKTVKRFPYFMVEVAEINGRLHYVHNEKPFLLARDRRKHSLRPADNNGYLIRVSIDGNKIHLYNLHCLTDGRGKLPFVKTLLNNYYAEIGIENDPPLDERYRTIPDDLALEYADPYANLPKDVPVLEFFKTERPHFRLPVKKSSPLTSYTYCIMVKTDDLMRFAKSTNGTPNVVISSILAKAILRVHPNALDGTDIKIDVIVDTKPSLGSMLSSISAYSAARLVYSDELLKKDITGQHTSLREMLKFQTTPDYMCMHAKNLQYAGDFLKTLPSMEARRAHADYIFGGFAGSATAGISYAGQSKLGSISNHVKHIRAIVEPSLFDLLIEVNCPGNDFDITITQSFESRIYVETMKEILDELGIPYSDGDMMVSGYIPYL